MYLNADNIPSEFEIFDASVEPVWRPHPLQGRLLEIRVDATDPGQLTDVQGFERTPALTCDPLSTVHG